MLKVIDLFHLKYIQLSWNKKTYPNCLTQNPDHVNPTFALVPESIKVQPKLRHSEPEICLDLELDYIDY